MAAYRILSAMAVPAAVAKLGNGQDLGVGEVVDLPESYGNHLVAEKLAAEVAAAPQPDEPDYEAMTKAELLAEAERLGVEVSSDDTKAEIKAAILAY